MVPVWNMREQNELPYSLKGNSIKFNVINSQTYGKKISDY
jgi:hypothetical protein